MKAPKPHTPTGFLIGVACCAGCGIRWRAVVEGNTRYGLECSRCRQPWGVMGYTCGIWPDIHEARLRAANIKIPPRHSRWREALGKLVGRVLRGWL